MDKWKTAAAGNSLIEYALPLGVFFVAGLALIFAADVPERLKAYLGDTMNGDVQGNSIAVAPLGTTAAGVFGGSGPPGGGGIPDTPFGFSDNGGGNGMTVGAVDSAAETAGGLGTQGRPEASSQNLERVASFLERDGADPTLVQLVTRLANRGHEIARAESNMPKIADINSSQDLYAALQAIQDDDTGLQGQLRNDFLALRAYLDAHPDVAQRYSGAFTRINSEYTNIVGYVDSLQIDGSEVNVSGIDPYGAMYGYGGYYGEPVVSGNLKIKGGDAEGVEGSSNTVCTSGGNTSTCVQDSTGNNTTSQSTSTTTTTGGGG